MSQLGACKLLGVVANEYPFKSVESAMLIAADRC
jgi:hypothetical protein